MAISDHFSKIITIIFVVCSEKRLLGQSPHTLSCSFDNHLSNAVYFVATAFLRGFFRAKKWPWVFPNTHDTHSSGVFFIVSVLFFHTHCARTNSIFDLHHWHNAGNHSMPLDSDGLAVTRQRPTHQTKVEWLLVTQPAKCRLWSYDLPKKAQFKETLKHDCCWCNNQKLSTDDMRRQTWAYTNPVHTDTLTLMLTHWNIQMYNQCYKNTVQRAGRVFKKGFCTTICSQMTLHYFQNNLHPKIHLCYESENESVVTCVQTGKWFWKYFSPCLFFLSLLALCRRGESRPLVMLLLGAINGNVSRLSKWWDLAYGIKASLDPHLLQMESALSQGVQHQGEAYWGIEKDKMTGNTFSLCLNYNLFQCI